MDLNGLPTELEHFVQRELQSGKYDSAEAVVSAALRLLQERSAPDTNSQPSSNAYREADLHSADEIIQAISDALATGKPDLARQLAMDGAQQYPEHEELQKFAHILAPPTVGQPIATSPETRAARKANHAWLKSNWQDYRGHWIALRAGQLLHASPSMDDLIAEIGEVRGQDMLLTKIAS